MYTAESIEKKIENGGLTVTVRFTNGTDTFTQDFYANSGMEPSWLQNSIYNKLLALNTLITFADALKLGAVENKRISPEPTDGQQLVSEILKLKKMKTLTDLGLLSESDCTEQRSKILKKFTKDIVDAIPLF